MESKKYSKLLMKKTEPNLLESETHFRAYIWFLLLTLRMLLNSFGEVTEESPPI